MELAKQVMGLGKKQALRLLLLMSVAVGACSVVVAPAFLAAEENEAEQSAAEAVSEQTSQPSAEVEDQSESAVADADSQASQQEDQGDAESEQGSSGEEAEPKQEERKESQAQEEEESKPEEKPEQDPKKDDKRDKPPKKKRIIGATAKILEKESGLVFNARVDTGAKSCSLHVEEMVIENEEEGFQNNINKVVKFKVRNGSDKTRLIERRIKKYVLIKTSGHVERRYKVPLTLSWNGGAVEKKVLVTLNNREGMNYPLLLGRNFLTNDFLVDVDVDSTD